MKTMKRIAALVMALALVFALAACGSGREEQQGGAAGMEKINIAKANMLYDVLDNAKLFTVAAEKGSRSFMNVTFRTGSEELDAEFVKGAAERGLLNVKGHRLTGGMRASLYNAMPIEGARALAQYMKDFEVAHHV